MAAIQKSTNYLTGLCSKQHICVSNKVGGDAGLNLKLGSPERPCDYCRPSCLQFSNLVSLVRLIYAMSVIINKFRAFLTTDNDLENCDNWFIKTGWLRINKKEFGNQLSPYCNSWISEKRCRAKNKRKVILLARCKYVPVVIDKSVVS